MVTIQLICIDEENNWVPNPTNLTPISLSYIKWESYLFACARIEMMEQLCLHICLHPNHLEAKCHYTSFQLLENSKPFHVYRTLWNGKLKEWSCKSCFWKLTWCATHTLLYQDHMQFKGEWRANPQNFFHSNAQVSLQTRQDRYRQTR